MLFRKRAVWPCGLVKSPNIADGMVLLPQSITSLMAHHPTRLCPKLAGKRPPYALGLDKSALQGARCQYAMRPGCFSGIDHATGCGRLLSPLPFVALIWRPLLEALSITSGVCCALETYGSSPCCPFKGGLADRARLDETSIFPDTISTKPKLANKPLG